MQHTSRRRFSAATSPADSWTNSWARFLLAPLLALFLVASVMAGSTAVAVPAAPAAGQPVVVSGLAGSSTAVIGYQCGAGVCLVDPDAPGARPTQVVPDGTFAGVTADGSTLAWVQPSGELVTAPTTGGSPRVVYRGEVGFQPLMSPDGTSFLWRNAVQVAGFYYTMRLDVATQEVAEVAACECVVSHGWSGQTSIGVFTSFNTTPARICVIDSGSSLDCVRVLAAETRGQLAFPDGSADGQTLVASVDADASAFGGSNGPLSLYSGATGALIKDLTTNQSDTTPTLSTEGDRVAFDRDGQIVVLDIATGAERTLGPGIYPSWGGTRGPGGGTDPAVVSVKGKSLKVKAGKIEVKLACAGTGKCQGKATLGKGKKTLAKRSYKVTAGKAGKTALKLTKAGKRRFKGHGKTKVRLVLRDSSGQGLVKTKVKVKY